MVQNKLPAVGDNSSMSPTELIYNMRKTLRNFLLKAELDANEFLLLLVHPGLLDEQRTRLFNEVDEIPYTITASEEITGNMNSMSILLDDDVEPYKPDIIKGGIHKIYISFSGDEEYKRKEKDFSVYIFMEWSATANSEMQMTTIVAVRKQNLAEFRGLMDAFDDVQHPILTRRDEMYVIGGKEQYIKPGVDIDDVILDGTLKQDVLNDVEAFFQTGVDIYTRHDLMPFRKILFAGMPGTGKTMMCNAIAKLYLEKGCTVVYVSGSDVYESSFWKVTEALRAASKSFRPAIVIVEELDTYMEMGHKSQVLNVLDGSETPENPYGTFLISTTNYPEIIDDRILKRPGRLDRIYTFPESKTQNITIDIMKKYLGEMWVDDFSDIADQLKSYSPAVIREICLYTLIQQSFKGIEYVDRKQLQFSVDTMLEQIKARDNLLQASNGNRETGFIKSSTDRMPHPRVGPSPARIRRNY